MGTPTPPRSAPRTDVDRDWSVATRYVCVGAEVDSNFAHQVIREVLENRYRAIAPSFGIDLVPVLRHALNGRRRRTTRDVTITLIAALNLLVNPVVTIPGAMSWLVTRFFYRSARLRWPARGPRYALAVGAIAYLTLGALLSFAVIAPVLAASSLGGRLFLLLGLFTGVVPLLSFLGVWGVLLWERLAMRSVLVDSLRWDTYKPAARSGDVPVSVQNPKTQQRLQSITDIQRRANVTVYSGHFPFLGAGDEVRTWSFALDLSRGRSGLTVDEREPEPFTVSELHDYVAKRLEALRSGDLDPAQRLSGLIVEDRLFISGPDVWSDRHFLPDPRMSPVTWVDPAYIQRIVDDPTGVVRYFKCVRVESWEREVVLSVFLHFATHGRTLYVEQTACLMPPIKAEYRVVDTMTRRLRGEEVINLLWATLKDVPAALLRAPVELWRSWRSAQLEQRQDERLRDLISEGLPIDYGARISIRELAAAQDCELWFQQLDAAKQLKVIELQLLNAILDFLEHHGVDTAEFRTREATILSNNIIMPNGSISQSTVAVGTGATAASGSGHRSAAGTPPR